MYLLSEYGELCQKKKVCCAKDDIKAPEPPGPKTPPPPGNATNCFPTFLCSKTIKLPYYYIKTILNYL